MDFALYGGHERHFSGTLDAAQWAEKAGFSSFWYPDHIMSQPDRSNGRVRGEEPALEAWTVLTGIGATVPRIRLVSMVTPLTFHEPVILAKRVATLDQIAPGRVVLGLGAGWQINEHEAYGFDLLAPKERVDRFTEGIEVIHQLLHNERSTFSGRYFTLDDATFLPRPEHLMLMVGSDAPRMLRLTARYAGEWNALYVDADLFRRKSELLYAACEREGRDPSTIRRTACPMLFITTKDSTRDKIRARSNPERPFMVGNVNELIDQLNALAEAGVDEFGIYDLLLGKSPAECREGLELLRTEVIPAIG